MISQPVLRFDGDLSSLSKLKRFASRFSHHTTQASSSSTQMTHRQKPTLSILVAGSAGDHHLSKNTDADEVTRDMRSSFSASSSSSFSSGTISLTSLDGICPSGPLPIDRFMDQVAAIAEAIDALKRHESFPEFEADEALRIGGRLKSLISHETDPGSVVSNVQERRLRASQIRALRWRLGDVLPRLETEKSEAYARTRDDLGRLLEVVMGQDKLRMVDLEALCQCSAGELDKILAENVRESRNYPASRKAATDAVEIIEELRAIRRRWNSLNSLSEELCNFEPSENLERDDRAEKVNKCVSEPPKTINSTRHGDMEKNEGYTLVRRHRPLLYTCTVILLSAIIILAVIIPIIFVHKPTSMSASTPPTASTLPASSTPSNQTSIVISPFSGKNRPI